MRPSWDATWMAVADAIAQRSKCVRRQAGVVIVSATNRIVSVGYNGAPAGHWSNHDRFEDINTWPRRLLTKAPRTCDEFCPRAKSGGTMSYDDCVAVHSEPNALMHADRSLMEGGTLYVTSCPCLTCAKDVSNSGVARVVLRIGEVDRDRHPELTLDFFQDCGVEVLVWENELES